MGVPVAAPAASAGGEEAAGGHTHGTAHHGGEGAGAGVAQLLQLRLNQGARLGHVTELKGQLGAHTVDGEHQIAGIDHCQVDSRGR